MPRTNFTSSTPITSEFLNKVARPRISNQDEDGAIPLLTNANLDSSPGNLLYDFYDFVDQFEVQLNPVGGLSVIVKGGEARLTDNANSTIPQTVLAVPNNTSSFISINAQGQLVATAIRPSYGYILARVTTANGSVTAIQDLRVNQTIIPQANLIDTFGGISQIDYSVPANTTVTLSGIIECRNFLLPANSTIRIAGALYIRASGNVDFLGSAVTDPVALVAMPYQDGQFGGSNYAITYASGSTLNAFSSGQPIRSRRRVPLFNGYTQIEFRTNTTASNAATFLAYQGNQINVGAANGADLTINAAGVLTIGNNASINLRAISPAKPTTIPAALTSLSGHVSTGTFANWEWIYVAISAQGSAGVCVLQSATTINVNQGAVINCRGSDEGWAIYTGANQSGAVTQPGVLGNGWFKCGAGGGGGIWIYSPTVNSHPSATYDVSAGTMGVPSGTNRYIQGVGSVGNGYNANPAIPAQNGQLVVTTGYPTEF